MFLLHINGMSQKNHYKNFVNSFVVSWLIHDNFLEFADNYDYIFSFIFY